MGDFHLKSENGLLFSLKNLKELNKADLKGNASLIRIFNIFDTQKSDGSSGSDGVLCKEELNSLFSSLSKSASKKSDSIFDEEEAEEYLSTTTHEGKSLKELGILKESLFEFLSMLVPSTQATNKSDAKEQAKKIFNDGKMDGNWQDTESLKDVASDYLINSAAEAEALFNKQRKEQGCVSDFYDWCKDFFGSKEAADKIYAKIQEEKISALLIQKAKEGTLTEVDYYKIKADLAEMLAEKTGNESYRKQAENYRSIADRIDAEQTEVVKTKEHGTLSRQKFRLMTFEETFERERGVKYDEEAVEDYNKKQVYSQMILGMYNQKELIKAQIDEALAYSQAAQNGGEYLMDSTRVEKLKADVFMIFVQLFGKENVQTKLQEMGLNGVLDPFSPQNNDANGSFARCAAKALSEYLENQFNKTCGDKTFEQIKKETTEAYVKAYGDRNSDEIVQAYIQSQKEGVQGAKTVAAGTGMLIMIAGQFVPAGNLATSMVIGGLSTAVVGSSAVGAAEIISQKGKADPKEVEALIHELELSVALTATGLGIGKITSSMYGMLVLKNCPMLLAKVSEIGADATMSLIATYALTGEIDISAETIGQLIPLLTGILKAKGNFKQYLVNDFKAVSRGAEIPQKEKTVEPANKTDTDITPSPVKKQETPAPPKINDESVVIKKMQECKTKSDFISAMKLITDDEDLLKLLENLSDKDVLILKDAFNDINHGFLPMDYTMEHFKELLNSLKQISLEKNSSLSEEINLVEKIMKEPSDENAPIIDCVAAWRVPSDKRQIEIIKRLFELRKTCDNSLLNIDNILYFAYAFKDISDIELLTKRLSAKNPDGTYKYGTRDFEKNDVDPMIKQKEFEREKNEYIEMFKDDPEVTKELQEFIKNATQEEFNEFTGNVIIHNAQRSRVLEYLRDQKPEKVLSDIKNCIGFIEESDIKNAIETMIKNTEDTSLSKQSRLNALKNIRNLVDAYNNLKGNYTNLDSKYWKGYLDFMEDFNPDLAKEIRGGIAKSNKPTNPVELASAQASKFEQFKAYIKKYYDKAITALRLKIDDITDWSGLKKWSQEGDAQLKKERIAYMLKEFEESQRVDKFVEYCKENKNVVSHYMYKDIYLTRTDLTPKIKQQCSNISTKYGVKIFLPKECDEELFEKLLAAVDTELSKWKKAGGDNAKMPPTLDFTLAKSSYYDTASAYGQGASAGFCESSASGAISMQIHSGYVDDLINTLRHELTHANDTAKAYNFPDGIVVRENDILIAEKCQYYDDFVKIGIPEEHIPYAYNNPLEFIAVASEGDLSKCTDEFKSILILFGMPEWRFNFD